MKNKETFIRMINFVHTIPYAFQNLDVGDFDFEIDFYDSEGNADIEEYFCSFPEYRRYLGYNIQCGPTFVYRFKIDEL